MLTDHIVLLYGHNRWRTVDLCLALLIEPVSPAAPQVTILPPELCQWISWQQAQAKLAVLDGYLQTITGLDGQRPARLSGHDNL